MAWSEPDPDLLVESPMDRFECCIHCADTYRHPRHDGHAGPCYTGCEEGAKMLGEP